MRILALSIAMALGLTATAASAATSKHKATGPRRAKSAQKRPALPGPLPYVGPRGDVVSRGWAPRLLRRPNPNLDIRALLLQAPPSHAALPQELHPLPNAERIIEISKSRHTLALVQNGETIGVFLLSAQGGTAGNALSNLASLPVGTFSVAAVNQDGAGHKALVLVAANPQTVAAPAPHPASSAAQTAVAPASGDAAQGNETDRPSGSYVGLPAPGLDLVCSFARVGTPVVIEP